jgi:ABC-type bacteriocin/lantibiotic exporter with double-glycine peptidase domain
MNWLNVPHQPQHKSSWCLPACVAMVSAYWGTPVLQADVARWLGTSEIGTPGSRVLGLVNRGYSVIYSEGSQSTLTEWIDRETPLILFVRTSDLLYWKLNTSHAVVLAGIHGERAILIDPGVNAEHCVVNIGNLLLAWSPFDYTFAVIKPTS